MVTPMLTGLMDHWVPSHQEISCFWKTPFEKLAPAMNRLCDDVGVNNFTFYTKWLTNGVNSKLPFLHNSPMAQNTITDNQWGRRWIEFFHERGMTVGAMLQCYCHEPGCLPPEGVLCEWPGTRRATGYDYDNVLADPLWPGFDALLEQMFEEQLKQFPGLDAIFLEFEGLSAVSTDKALRRLAIDADTDPRHVRQWEESGWPVPEAERWLWTVPVQEALMQTLRSRLTTAERVMQRMGFKGRRGVVYHAMGYETPYVAASLPGSDWWLLPWHYWGWTEFATLESSIQRRQIAWCLEQWRGLIKQGYSPCYIGNATLPTTQPQTIEEIYAACLEMGMPGYIGMGNPIPEIGLRWHGATADWIAEARKIQERMFPVPR